MLPLKFIFYFFYFTVKTISRRVSDSSTCYQSSTEEIFFFIFHFFDVGVALVPRPLFKSSSILCQET